MLSPMTSMLSWLVVSGLCFAGGEYLSKKFILHPSWITFTALLCLYCCGALAWLPALMHGKNLSVVGTIWSVISLLMTIAIGVMVFHEPITALRAAGMMLAVAAIIAMSLS